MAKARHDADNKIYKTSNNKAAITCRACVSCGQCSGDTPGKFWTEYTADGDGCAHPNVTWTGYIYCSESSGCLWTGVLEGSDESYMSAGLRYNAGIWQYYRYITGGGWYTPTTSTVTCDNGGVMYHYFGDPTCHVDVVFSLP